MIFWPLEAPYAAAQVSRIHGFCRMMQLMQLRSLPRTCFRCGGDHGSADLAHRSTRLHTSSPTSRNQVARPNVQSGMRRTLGAIMTLLAAGSMLAGCAAGATPTTAPGAVEGQFIRVGGPPPGAAVPLPGQVMAIDSTGARLTVGVGNNGRFRLSLPAGTYRLIGYSPLIQSGKARCSAARPVHVTTGRTTRHVAVVCSIS